MPSPCFEQYQDVQSHKDKVFLEQVFPLQNKDFRICQNGD